MKLCRCTAIIDTVSEGSFIRRGTVFVTSLAQAIRLAGSVQRGEVFEEPDEPAPMQPNAGTFAGADGPPSNRMIKREFQRRADKKLGDNLE